MQEPFSIHIPDQVTTLTIQRTDIDTSTRLHDLIFNQREGHFERYDAVQFQNPHSYSAFPNLFAVQLQWSFPLLLICDTPDIALEVRSQLVEWGVNPSLIGQPRYGYRERLVEPVEGRGKFNRQIPGGEAYGHVVLQVIPDPSLDEVIFESCVDEETIPSEFLPYIGATVREAVFRGGPKGYPLTGLRVTLVGGSYHPVDSNQRGFRYATLMALWHALYLRETGLIALPQ